MSCTSWAPSPRFGLRRWADLVLSRAGYLDSITEQRADQPPIGEMSAQMSSTTETGDRFRDEVADLLRAAGYSVVVEILDGHKRVDIRFEEKTFGKVRTYALEAKNWESPLDHGDLEKIYGGYAALLNRHEVDELLVISKLPIRSPAARAFVRDTPRFSHP